MVIQNLNLDNKMLMFDLKILNKIKLIFNERGIFFLKIKDKINGDMDFTRFCLLLKTIDSKNLFDMIKEIIIKKCVQKRVYI